MNNNNPYSNKATEQNAPPKKRIRWLFIASLFAVPILILLLATFAFRVAWTIRENSGREAFYNELAKLEDEGIPVDDASLAERTGFLFLTSCARSSLPKAAAAFRTWIAKLSWMNLQKILTLLRIGHIASLVSVSLKSKHS
jgi:hypothetical protein